MEERHKYYRYHVFSVCGKEITGLQIFCFPLHFSYVCVAVMVCWWAACLLVCCWAVEQRLIRKLFFFTSSCTSRVICLSAMYIIVNSWAKSGFSVLWPICSNRTIWSRRWPPQTRNYIGTHWRKFSIAAMVSFLNYLGPQNREVCSVTGALGSWVGFPRTFNSCWPIIFYISFINYYIYIFFFFWRGMTNIYKNVIVTRFTKIVLDKWNAGIALRRFIWVGL